MIFPVQYTNTMVAFDKVLPRQKEKIKRDTRDAESTDVSGVWIFTYQVTGETMEQDPDPWESSSITFSYVSVAEKKQSF